MKKCMMRWGDDDDDEDSSEESSSSSASDSNADNTETGKKKKKKRKSKKAIARFAKKEKKAFDYESLQQHGYKAVGLPDIPPPQEKEADWSWATGKDKQRADEVKESYREREATRAAVAGGETIAQLRSDRKSLSFSQKEKKKRDLGQASRGKNYVEEEKRQLRESGVYSGFDS